MAWVGVFLALSTRFHVCLAYFHRGLRASLSVGVVALSSCLICISGLAQTDSTKANADAADANSIYDQGMAALQQRDLAGARAAFEKTVKLVPRSPEPHNSLGWVLLAQGETDAAIGEFKTAVRLKPDFAQAYMNFSRALLQKGDVQGAVREAREAVRLAPGDSERNNIRGRSLAFPPDQPAGARKLKAEVEIYRIGRNCTTI